MSKSWSDDYSIDEESFYSEIIDFDDKPAWSSELDSMKAELLKTKQELTSQTILTAELQQKEKTMQEEIDRLKEQVCTERELRQKAEDARGMDLTMYKLDMARVTSSSEELMAELQRTKEELASQKVTVAELQQKERTTQEEIIHLQEQVLSESQLREKAEDVRGMDRFMHRFREKMMKDEIDRLKEQVLSETQLRQKAEDDRGMNLVLYKLELARLGSSSEKMMAAVQKIQDKDAEVEVLKNEGSKTTATLRKVRDAARQTHSEWELERQSIVVETEEKLQETEAETEMSTEKPPELELVIDEQLKTSRKLSSDLEKEPEQKAERVQKIAEMQTLIQDLEESPVQVSRTCQAEKDCFLKEFQGKVEADEAEKQALVEKSEGLEQTAILEKSSHEKAVAELLEEKESSQKDVHELRAALRSEEGEVTHLQEMINTLDQEPEKRWRKWYRKLLCH